MKDMVSIETTQSEIALSGQLLVAMPHMEDPRFARTVVYVCAHSDDGAMGLVVNRLIDSMRFDASARPSGHGDRSPRIRTCLCISADRSNPAAASFCTAPISFRNRPLLIDDDVALTATTEMLKAIAGGSGPEALRPRPWLCRLGGRAARSGNPEQWLASRSGRRSARLRLRQRSQMGRRHDQARHRPLPPLLPSRPRLAAASRGGYFGRCPVRMSLSDCG